jgi:hypothetical protein
MEAARGTTRIAAQRPAFPLHGWVGLALVLVAWPLNWLLEGTRTVVFFFPLWFGYALTVDGLVYLRKGTSLITRSRAGFAALFLVSAPAWWLFEVINYRTQNWFYLGVDHLSALSYFLLASLSFSTVIPAVFGTAELAGTFIKKVKPWLVIRDDRRTTLAFFIAGWVMLALLLAWPLYFFPFVWISVYFITEPVNVWLGNRSLVEGTRVGDWRVVCCLFAGVLVTGFFWEMWNFYAYPKWIYQVPGVDVLRVFEMPLLGYGGYLPFALELYALYHLIMGFFGRKRTEYIKI